MFNLVERENLIFEILQEFMRAELRFVLVGGYAVSAYKHRFSVDADLVLKKDDLEKFEELLRYHKLEKTIVKKLDHVYASEFIRYETKQQPPASFDLLINGLGSRTTYASFSLELLEQHSRKRKVIGTEKEVTLLVPDPEVLIALKIHSGRLTDFRDIVALCHNINLEIVRKLIMVGNTAVVKQNIQKLLGLLERKEFMDSFKGVFMEKKYDVNIKEVQALKGLIPDQER